MREEAHCRRLRRADILEIIILIEKATGGPRPPYVYALLKFCQLRAVYGTELENT